MSTSVAPVTSPPQSEEEEKEVQIFVSHKHGEGDAAEKIKSMLEEYGADRLEVHVSELIAKGEEWDEKLRHWLRKSDWLLLLYTGPGVEWDWCLYETGFYAGAHQDTKRRLVCLHPEAVAMPEPLKGWQGATEKTCEDLLRQIYKEVPHPGTRPLNSKIKDETLKKLAESIMHTFTETPKPVVLTPFLELTLDQSHRDELRDSGTLADDILVESDFKAREIFGVQDYLGNKSLRWADVAAQLDLTRQKGWIRAVSDSLRRLSRRQRVSTTFPIVYSVMGESQKRWRPILYSVQTGSGKDVFRIIFSEILPEDDPRPDDPKLDNCITLMAMGRMIQFGVIERYLPMIEGLLLRKKAGDTINPEYFDDNLASLPAAIDRMETEARNAGLRSPDKVIALFDDDQAEESKKLESWTGEWIGYRKQLAGAVAGRNLEELEAALDGMRNLNRASFGLFAHRYAELIDQSKY